MVGMIPCTRPLRHLALRSSDIYIRCGIIVSDHGNLHRHILQIALGHVCYALWRLLPKSEATRGFRPLAMIWTFNYIILIFLISPLMIILILFAPLASTISRSRHQ
ncbi:hypothetical protein BDR07DRAFT_1418583 [Suillus spraguei]|nr:hypothetical protein BDR07DRAFT_1440791 [Suillus spraguei]KAG2358105.1 hypothetical protein BDR07DRAFT_1418583 [Suillus spraguei]